MAESDGDGFLREGMRCRGTEVWASQVLVQVGAAYTDIAWRHLFTSLVSEMATNSEAYLDLAGFHCGLRNLLDTNVFYAVVSRRSHHGAVKRAMYSPRSRATEVLSEEFCKGSCW